MKSLDKEMLYTEIDMHESRIMDMVNQNRQDMDKLYGLLETKVKGLFESLRTQVQTKEVSQTDLGICLVIRQRAPTKECV